MNPLLTRDYRPLLKMWIPGEPVPKGRPRLGANGNVRTPESTVDGENWVRSCLIQATVGMTINPKGEFEVLVFYFCRSKVTDLDNLIKLDLDALNGYVWMDDRQVTHIDATLYRIERDLDPGTQLVINQFLM